MALSKENEKESADERRWFVTLSDALVRGHPFLGITHAFTLMTTNQWEGQGEDKAHGMCNEMTGSHWRKERRELSKTLLTCLLT